MCPSLPIYNSRNNIQPMQSAPFRQEAGQDAANQNQVLNTVTQIAQKWSDANDVMQATEAKTKYEISSAEIQSRAAADPDFNNSTKYFKELEKVKVDSLKGVANQSIAGQLRLDFERGNAVTAMKIGADFQMKQIQAHKINVAQSLDIMQQKRLNASTDIERKQIDGEMQGLINASLASGVLEPQEAMKLKEKSTLSAYENMIYSNPEFAIEQLKKAEDLTPKQRENFIEDAKGLLQKRKEYADWQLEQTQTQSTIQLAEAMQNGSLTSQMVRDMQQGGLIDSETAAIFDSIALDEPYEIPEETVTNEPDYLLRLLEDSNGDKPQIKKILKSAARAYADNKIGSNQYSYFLQEAKEIFDRQSKGIFTKSPTQQKVMGAIYSMKEFFGGMGKTIKESNENLKTSVDKFFDRFRPGDNPEKIKKEIVDEFMVEKNPAILNIPEEGQMFYDADGSIKMIKRGENGLEITEPGE